MKIRQIEEDVKPTKRARQLNIDESRDSELCTVVKDPTVSGLEEMRDSALRLYKDKTFQVIGLISEMKLPEPNEQIRIITRRSFNAISFLKYIADKEVIEEMTACIYSINYEGAMLLNDLLNAGRIEKATLVISNLRNKAHREKEQLTKDLFIANKKIKLIFLSSHAKIISFSTKAGNFYTIEGSGNLAFNSRIEQYVIDNDKDLFDFTNKWVWEMVDFLKGRKELITYNI